MNILLTKTVNRMMTLQVSKHYIVHSNDLCGLLSDLNNRQAYRNFYWPTLYLALLTQQKSEINWRWSIQHTGSRIEDEDYLNWLEISECNSSDRSKLLNKLTASTSLVTSSMTSLVTSFLLGALLVNKRRWSKTLHPASLPWQPLDYVTIQGIENNATNRMDAALLLCRSYGHCDTSRNYFQSWPLVPFL